MLASEEFVHAEKLVVDVALFELDMSEIIRALSTVVVSHGMTPLVSFAAESFPSEKTSQGLPFVLTPEKR